MISMVCTLFPVDSIVSSIYGIGVLNDITWLLAMDPVLWALLRPLMKYLCYLSHTRYMSVFPVRYDRTRWWRVSPKSLKVSLVGNDVD